MHIKQSGSKLMLGIGVGLLLFLLAWLAFERPARGQSSGVARGESIAQEKCSRCHATGRADSSPNPKAPPFRDVGKIYPPEHLAEALSEGIVTGDNDMPKFKFNPRDVDAIIEYLEALSSASKL